MAELSKIKFNGAEYDLKDAVAREAIENFPEDKIFPVNVTLTSMTEGTSDKTHIEILAAVNAGKIPFVYIDYSGSKMIASLLFANSNRVSFVYDNQVTEGFGDYAFLQIQNSNVTITWKDKYITQDDLPDTSNFMVRGRDYVTAGQKAETTLGTYSTAEGAHVIASGNASHAEGSATTASGQYSHAEGMGQCYTLGKISGDANATTYTATSVENIVIGQDLVYNGKTAKVTSLDRNSKTFTVNNTLSEEAVSEVYFTIDNKSSGKAAHSEGEGCISSNLSAHAEGGYTVASGVWTHTEGYGTRATSGQSHAEGQFTQALAVDAHSEGYSTTASGVGAHAEGGKTVASGKYAHAENYSTIASGNYSHAEGYNTNASGSLSHASGHTTTASGLLSHAEGWNTIASRESQFVFGELNIEDTEGTSDSRGKYIEIVGNGTEEENNVVTRSNARTLDWSGNETLAGKLTVGAGPTANMDVATKQYVDAAIGNVNSFNVSVVSTLPATGDAHTIYFVSQASPSTAHDEYMYINNSWELIGSTQIDLSNYLQTTDIADWAKAATKPTYTAAEVGALPNTTVIPAAQVNSDWNATSGKAQILNKPTLPPVPTNLDSDKVLTASKQNSTIILEATNVVMGDAVGDPTHSLDPDLYYYISGNISPSYNGINNFNVVTQYDDHGPGEITGYPLEAKLANNTYFIYDTDGMVDILKSDNGHEYYSIGEIYTFTNIKIEEASSVNMSWEELPYIPNSTSDLTNDSGFVTTSNVQDYLLNPQVGIGRIRYEFVSELPNLENPEFILPDDFTIYIVDNDGLYKLNDARDGWDKIYGFSNYITTTNHTQETPQPNTVYYDIDNNNTYIYDGTNWQQIGYIPNPYQADIKIYTITESNGTYSISPTSSKITFYGSKLTILKYNDEYYYQRNNTHFATPLDPNKNYKEFVLNTPTMGTVSVSSFSTYSAAPTITNTLSSGTLIATINGTNIYAPSYTDADGVSY